ncbi:hypothetical protein BGW36DRAFT_385604 [Talaromyces proteolyticus]|uniref:Mid2 domain-containing protein n=1 Tax=Talaromyces proteolyticus TaxID=1131652 RepID=A0AAD4KN50_9EURO|nr:uncharacterized protein BGW36DRAFT_385604 [Talaromyces proteolyticus]KAH8692965.1 hypothetical protein BGW36DRAFT_385604 [Talaromyces proteolyticus]
MWYSFIILLPPLATALCAPTASVTISIHGKLLPQPTSVFDDESHAALRRDATNSASTTQVSLVTSYAPPSVCGWSDGDATSGALYCSYGAQCLFHASDSAWPAMRGCCPLGYDGGCEFETTCYDSSRLSATPSLLSTTDPFGVYCPDTIAPSCIPIVFPQLGYTDYGCGTVFTTLTIYTDLTITPTASSSSAYITMASMSSVPDSLLQELANYDHRTSSSSSLSSPPPPSPSPSTPVSISKPTFSAVPSSAGSSTPVGAIVGGVVGGVVGIGALCAASFIFWLSKKKQKSKMESTEGQLNPRYSTVPQSFQTSIISEVDGAQVPNTGRAELYVPEIYSIRQEPVEMDAHGPKGVVELPSK